MLDLTAIPEGHLDLVRVVVEEVLKHAPDLATDDIMLVGAWCRDTMHVALGHTIDTRITHDVDLALGLREWATFDTLAAAFDPAGSSGVCFRIGGAKVDLLPFGSVESPKGEVVPPTREERLSVWAFEEIHQHSVPLRLGEGVVVRMPTVPGYAAVKLAAWLDRSEWLEPKDAMDLALAAYWYAQSTQVEDLLYDTHSDLLEAEEFDVARSATRLLGREIVDLIGPARRDEVLSRWPGDVDQLITNFAPGAGTGWPGPAGRRRQVVDALTRGLLDDRVHP
ncbi:Predicted nucleotidyltransferase [Nocardioides exalbidus]|uniref:Predicted nucleotidyltransferase n=1 Tax=Nocardioides exalbidus TaxID=402596 RepID=A0A1H4N679_9ACTN|nr:hypothetical protein [Nocardioides exalbidus]SEB90627.1 Predicted nucleotidyltransferase [Nocardioides exalbidus]